MILKSVYYVSEGYPGKKFLASPLFEANLKTGEIIAYEAVKKLGASRGGEKTASRS